MNINSTLKQHDMDKLYNKFPFRNINLCKNSKSNTIKDGYSFKNRTLLCTSCSICPTIYVNKHLSRLTYGRAPAKGSNPFVTQNRRITPIHVFLIIVLSLGVFCCCCWMNCGDFVFFFVFLFFVCLFVCVCLFGFFGFF